MIVNDKRQNPRHAVHQAVEVIDTMTGETLGQLGNISETGMLLISSVPLVEDALYQLQVRLSDGNRPDTSIDIGVHLVWTGPASAPGLHWAGLRFLTLSHKHRLALYHWMSTLNT